MTFFESSSVVQIVEHLLYDNFVLTLQHFFFDDITKLHWLSYVAFTPEMLPLSIIFGNTGRQIWPKPWQHRWAALLSTRHKGFQDLQRSSFTTTNQLSTHTHIWSCVSIYLTLLQKLLAFVSVLVALYTSTLVVYIIKKSHRSIQEATWEDAAKHTHFQHILFSVFQFLHLVARKCGCKFKRK